MTRARSACAVPGCPGFAVRRGRCEEDALRPWEGSYEARSQGAARPSPKLKRAVRERSRGYCERCGSPVPLGSGRVDHRVPWAEGGETTEANLWHLCGGCDRAK